MASTFFGLTIAYTGLQAAQTSINVTSHNLANINTPGYTKEAATQQASDALRTYSTYGTIGSGVTVTGIDQTRDSYYDEKYRNNMTNYGEYEAKHNYMTQIEDYLNEFKLDGYSKEYKNFFSAVNQLSLTPSDESCKNQLINNAKSMTDYFNTLAANLRNVQADANNEIKDAVEHINSLAQNIASLNKQINQIEACYGNANDLRDQRNALVDELSQVVNITTNEVDLGNNLTSYQISINGQTLVDTYEFHTLECVSRDELRNASDADGLYDIQWSDGNKFDIYSKTLGGQLKALVDIRDGCNGEIESVSVDANGNYVEDHDGNIITETNALAEDNTIYKGVPYYQSQLNQFIRTFAQAVNDILKTGYRSDADVDNAENRGISLFVVQDNTRAITATNITVNKELIDDPNRLATKSSVGTGEANADIIEQINDLQSAKIFDGGTGSYFLESIVSDMSIDSNKSKNFLANYTNLKTSIQNQRLSVMGVDTDEEAMDLVKFQQAYNLSSKMMTVMNDIYDKLINGTGV
ncbi:MAG: flagellar hook-associated protein FlgK [Eubacteriales bacterium]|nr:flagellar hook-associated protein FlgK [Eubacteriales bacterium]